MVYDLMLIDREYWFMIWCWNTKDESPGLYRLTAAHIESELKQLNATIADDADKVLLSCRFAELYQGKMRDLFGNLVEWFVDRTHIQIISFFDPLHKLQSLWFFWCWLSPMS